MAGLGLQLEVRARFYG